MNNTLQILIKAREIIYDSRNWCQDAFAREKKDGAVVAPEDRKACRWNIFGAVRRAGGRHVMFYLTEPEAVLCRLAQEAGFSCAQSVAPHAQVLRLLQEAIVEAQV